MKNLTVKAFFLVAAALISASASATLADRISDIDDDSRGGVASSPYSGQKVVRGEVISK